MSLHKSGKNYYHFKACSALQRDSFTVTSSFAKNKSLKPSSVWTSSLVNASEEKSTPNVMKLTFLILFSFYPHTLLISNGHVSLWYWGNPRKNMWKFLGGLWITNFNKHTPWKINMEPTNHPIRKENHLNQTSMRTCSNFNLPGCMSHHDLHGLRLFDPFFGYHLSCCNHHQGGSSTDWRMFGVGFFLKEKPLVFTGDYCKYTRWFWISYFATDLASNYILSCCFNLNDNTSFEFFSRHNNQTLIVYCLTQKHYLQQTCIQQIV